MEIKGKIIAALPLREGETARGKWKAQSYVLETEEMYPKHVVFDVFDGDTGRISRLGITPGKSYNVYFDIDAHQFDGRWYNQVRAYDARLII